MRSEGYVEDDEYRISNDGLIDLNQDGICEIIAFQRIYCGMGGCTNSAFQLDGDDLKYIGIGPSRSQITFYEPHNGDLQFRDATYTGKNYSYH